MTWMAQQANIIDATPVTDKQTTSVLGCDQDIVLWRSSTPKTITNPHGACECQIFCSHLKVNSKKWKITSRHGAPQWFHQQLTRVLCCVCSGKYMKYLSLMKMQVLDHVNKWWSKFSHSRRALALFCLWIFTHRGTHTSTCWSSNMYAPKLILTFETFPLTCTRFTTASVLLLWSTLTGQTAFQDAYLHPGFWCCDTVVLQLC